MRKEIPSFRSIVDRACRRVLEAKEKAFALSRGELLVVSLLALVVLGAGAGALLFAEAVNGLPDNRSLREIGQMAQASTLFDLHDRPVFTLYQEQRIEVPLAAVSPDLVHAVVAVEDQRFFDHGGIDVVRVVSAALINLRHRRVVQGASTITQQLARQAFLTPDRTLRRKVKEAVLAYRIERQFSKRDILELYLNKVYFGDGLYGAEAASLGYFGKHARDLDVAEAALLAGLVKSPSTYAPTVSRSRALARRAVVLQAMRDSRVIDESTYARARREPLHLVDALRAGEGYGQYFKEEVRKQLTELFGMERVYQGGLRVHTTLDLDMQKAAEAEVEHGLVTIEARQRRSARSDVHPTAPLQAALVALDPLSGEVRAMVGGRDFKQSPFNRAVQARRQPGSAFKPFVYATALEHGYTPSTLITGLNAPVPLAKGEWSPEDEHVNGDAITMRAALRTSSNRAAVRVLEDVGIPQTVSYAKRMGIGSLPNVPSLALGSGEVTLLAMTSAFGAFANRGVLFPPTVIRRVESAEGALLYEPLKQPQQTVSEATAYLMTSMLADVVNSGTAWPARREGFTLPAAGKTGTTNDYHDAWFVGYTPKLVAGVWVGYDQPRTIVSHGYAAELAVPLWGRFMKTATAHDDAEPFAQPASVVPVSICRITGKRATDACRDAVVVASDGSISHQSAVYTEYFVRGTEPTTWCPGHTLPVGEVAVSGTLGIETAPSLLPSSPFAQGTVAQPTDSPALSQLDAGRGDATGQPAPDHPRRKFWHRLFGHGGDQVR
jgi:penicillin-binding protein 1A